MARTITGGRKRHEPVRHKMHVRRGDRVRVIRGTQAGREGTVLRLLPKENRVVIEGVNMRKRHTRPSQANPEGGILTFEAPIHASNVMLLDPNGDPTRVRQRYDADVSEKRGEKRSRTKERVSVRTGNPIPRARN
jgi:large subunit ribosomal protein L24